MKMIASETHLFLAALERKVAELVQILRKRDDIAIERSADQLDQIQYSMERDLAIRNVDRDSAMLRAVGAAIRALPVMGVMEPCLAFTNILARLTAKPRISVKNSPELTTIVDQVAQPGWTWFKEGLACGDPKLAHALIVSGRAMGQTEIHEWGMRALRWLIGVQTSEHGQLRPIGSSGFYRRSGPRTNFDQQQIEAHATVSVCLEAYRATGDLRWYEDVQRAFDWFLGWNDLGLALHAQQTGGCRDGFHPDRANENQGAESMLAFLLSLAEMRLVQNSGSCLPSAAAAAAFIQ